MDEGARFEILHEPSQAKAVSAYLELVRRDEGSNPVFVCPLLLDAVEVCKRVVKE